MIGDAVLQAAIFAALNGQISAQVFDEIPPGTASLTKYVMIGLTVTSRAWDTHDTEGSETYPQIDVWSRAQGARETQLLMEEIDARLHNQALPLSSGQLVLLQRDDSRVLKEEVRPGETWRHGVLRYRALISE